MSSSVKGIIGTSALYFAGFVSGGLVFSTQGSLSDKFCESQAPRVTASTPSNIFNRCTRELPDGSVLTWDRTAQHKKDLQSGAALTLK